MKLEQLLETNVKKYGEYPMLYFQEKQFTNIETKRISDRFAAGLRKQGIGEGDRVMVILPNCPEVIFSYQAINRAGAIIVPVMFTLHPKEIHYIVAKSGVKAIITSSFVLEKVRSAVQDLDFQPAIIAVDVPTGNDVLNFYDVLVDNNNKIGIPNTTNENDTAVILYTSGTTGSPKGVLLTHKNLYTNAENSAKHNETERGTTLGVLPLAHVYGLTVSNITMLLGSAIVIFPSFNIIEVFAAIEKHRVRTFSAVPAMIHAMLSYPDSDKFDTSSLESVSSGSAPLPVALLHAFQSKFNADVYEGYGLSEAAPIVTAHRKGIQIKPGSVGIPIPGVEIKIVDENGNNLPVGEVGELIVRGDNVTQGYYNNPEETEKILMDGWLHTGDMARLDNEGYLYIVDRKKDLIIRGGFNLYPRDVEEILNRHEAVSEASVIGIPDERMGEEMVACVVKKEGSEVCAEELIGYCQEHLAKNKTPRQILFMEALPRNGVGKILKTHLRQTAADIISSTNQK
ncbi:class I adenylate-forming enzyme family protein [Mesobacillus maritimus]|uniref:Long-chain-fatty-acid--CoA ligase n=1 Tax=Mesobacillus maritimus TaxID=1643336 RepID=A0ABS7K3F7_9BACI|nr:long-chain-fatty-acid--CoA ligase [Mesobacillus maritimus]MBY0096799.1 long-chain-fatty-acid--CoA ligase [Mesobacillus maritimus]